MDYDLSTQSIRSALSELQLKVKLLEDERDHYEHMYVTTTRSFEDHRRELSSLLQKERNYASNAEAKLQSELHNVLSENTLHHARLVEQKTEWQSKMREAVEEFQAEQRLKEERLRAEIRCAHDELLNIRRSSAKCRDEKRTTEAEMTTMLQQQTSLQEEIETLKAQRFQLEEQLLVDQMNYDRIRRSPNRPCRSNSGDSRGGARSTSATKKVFLPSGKTVDRQPASYNINAVVQTLEHRALLQPRSFDGTKSGKQLDAVCRTVITELLDMKKEYALLTDRLGDPLVDSVEISKRLRQLMYDIDRKTEQLRQLRRQQARIDDDMRVHEMFKDISQEQGVYESMHHELLRILRESSR